MTIDYDGSTVMEITVDPSDFLLLVGAPQAVSYRRK